MENNQDDINSGSYNKPVIQADATDHVSHVEDIDATAHNDLAGTGAQSSGEAALKTPITGGVTVAEKPEITDLPKDPPKLRGTRFGLYHFLRRQMDQRVNKVRLEKQNRKG